MIKKIIFIYYNTNYNKYVIKLSIFHILLIENLNKILKYKKKLK